MTLLNACERLRRFFEKSTKAEPKKIDRMILPWTTECVRQALKKVVEASHTRMLVRY